MGFLTEIPFLNDYVLPVIDIALLAFLLYKIYEILEETRAIQLLRGGIVLALVYAAAWLLRLSTLLWILEMIAPGLFIGVAIVFQPELRNIFARIGQREIFRGKIRQKPFQVETVLNAAEVLSERRRGALVVFARKVGLKNLVDTGTRLDSELSSALILTIFGHDGPLHDGALIIQSGRLMAAGCFLPLSNQPDIRRSFGTRHRAALGTAEETDAVVLAVSEETGALSLAYDGNIFYDLEEEDVRRRLHDLLGLSPTEGNDGGNTP
ncbi:MAG: diadenylate cyclase CdaA [Spirochaetales bacterium]|nr:diadenylate cyclase CdaA [Spirochaetales bacterium]